MYPLDTYPQEHIPPWDRYPLSKYGEHRPCETEIVIYSVVTHIFQITSIPPFLP